MTLLRSPLHSPLRSPLYSPLVGKWGEAYDADALALFARFTTSPTDIRKVQINTLILALKAAGVWSKRDAIYLTAAADSQAARRNWIADQYNLSTVNSPTFTADRGYAGDGASSYLDTNFNATTAVSPKFTQNSANIAAWDRTSRAAANTSLMGARQSTTNYIDLGPRVVGDLFVGRMQTNVTGFTNANTQSAGHFSVNRSASNAIEGYRGGSQVVTATPASVAPPNANIVLLARSLTSSSPDAYTSDQIAFAAFGGSLTLTEIAAEFAAVQTYLQAVGAA
jgi:hypothetical protein